MVHELVRYMKSVNMHGEKIEVKNVYLPTRKVPVILIRFY